MISDLQSGEKVTYAVGEIVLHCQTVEQLFKFILPHVDGKAPDWTSRAERMDKLARKPLGEIARRFLEVSKGNTDVLRARVESVIDKRNKLVHHFGDVYGPRMSAGLHDAVLTDLRHLRQEVMALLRFLHSALYMLLQLYRDTVFAGTDEYAGFAAICEDLRLLIEAVG